jgi:hypothetical protein
VAVHGAAGAGPDVAVFIAAKAIVETGDTGDEDLAATQINQGTHL